jgi:hypothetical protein
LPSAPNVHARSIIALPEDQTHPQATVQRGAPEQIDHRDLGLLFPYRLAEAYCLRDELFPTLGIIKPLRRGHLHKEVREVHWLGVNGHAESKALNTYNVWLPPE